MGQKIEECFVDALQGELCEESDGRLAKWIDLWAHGIQHLHLHLVILQTIYPKRLTIGEYIKRLI